MKKIEKKHLKRAGIGFVVWIIFSLLVSGFQLNNLAALIVAGFFGVIYYLMAVAELNPIINGLGVMWRGDLEDQKKEDKN